MRFRQMVLVVGIVLIVSGQTIAGVNLRPGTACSNFTEQNSPISIPTLWMEADSFSDFTKSGTIPPFVDVSCFDMIPPTGPVDHSLNQSVTEPYQAFGISTVEGKSLNALVDMFPSDDAPLRSRRPPSLIFGISDMTDPLLRQVFAIRAGLKNVAIPSGATHHLFETSDVWQWNSQIGELNLIVNPVPAPAAILIGSIAVGWIGWMRIYKAYTQ